MFDSLSNRLQDVFANLGREVRLTPETVEVALREIRMALLEVVMLQAEGNQTRAAELLGINRNTLRKKLQEHGIE